MQKEWECRARLYVFGELVRIFQAPVVLATVGHHHCHHFRATNCIILLEQKQAYRTCVPFLPNALYSYCLFSKLSKLLNSNCTVYKANCKLDMFGLFISIVYSYDAESIHMLSQPWRAA